MDRFFDIQDSVWYEGSMSASEILNNPQKLALAMEYDKSVSNILKVSQSSLDNM